MSRNSVPAEVFTFQPGASVYAYEPGVGSEGWLPAVVTQVYNNGTAQVRTTAGKVFIVRNCVEHLLPASKEATKGIPDIINLDVLHEGAIQESVAVRYARNDIYTFVGPLLISVNPYTMLPLYEATVIQGYINGTRKEPHLYSVAHQAYQAIKREDRDQSILISGESGAGKTEATKIVLQYLTEISTQFHQAGTNLPTAQQRILDANPILEAFGNAKTVRNNNSSRFGKFFQVQFNENNQIIGATIFKYLLEKSRVVSHGANERNYHIFYQLCAGASDADRNMLSLGAAEDFYYLVQSGCCTIPGVNDAEGFQGVRRAFDVLGFTSSEVACITQCLAAILHLGNVSFVDGADHNAEVPRDDAKSAFSLVKVAELLGVKSGDLERCLLHRTMAPGNMPQAASCKIPLDRAGALDARDALAKEIYNKLFDWLVKRINSSMDHAYAMTKSVGVLDIFGFEVLDSNSFEQLCINYANEKLHQMFVNNYFKAEMNEYQAEGVAVDFINFRDNAACLSLIERKPLGLLALLHEECSLRKCTDASFVAKLNTSLRTTPHFIERKLNPLQFGIAHYARPVTYDAVGFLEKNKDLLHADVQSMMRESKVAFVQAMFQPSPGTAPANSNGARATARSMVTVAGQFKEQVESLTMLLKATSPHYIRCIKPNESKAAASFEGGLVLQQLQYSGVLESIKIRRAGYSARFTYQLFTQRWFPVCPSHRSPSNLQEWTRAICSAAGVHEWFYAFGRTKVFFKHPDVVTHLDNHLEYALAKGAVTIQSSWRAMLCRRRLRNLNKCAVRIQAAVRAWLSKTAFRRATLAILCMQRWWRGALARRLVRQRLARGREERRLAAEEKRRAQEISLQQQQEMFAKQLRHGQPIIAKDELVHMPHPLFAADGRSSSFSRVSLVQTAAALSGKVGHDTRYHSASSEGSFEGQYSDHEDNGCISTLHPSQRRRSPRRSPAKSSTDPQSENRHPSGGRPHRAPGSKMLSPEQRLEEPDIECDPRSWGPVVIRSGWLLMELFEPYHEWKLRFCVLAPGRLVFYTSSDCTDHRGSMALPTSTQVDADPLHKPDPTYAYVLVVNGRTRSVRLAAATATNQREWMASIISALADPHAKNSGDSPEVHRVLGIGAGNGNGNEHHAKGPAVTIMGWLHKQDKASGKWKRRFFVLRGAWLLYHLDERCRDCVGEAQIGRDSRVLVEESGLLSTGGGHLGWDAQHVLRIAVSPQREIVVAADDDLLTLEKWAQFLEMVRDSQMTIVANCSRGRINGNPSQSPIQETRLAERPMGRPPHIVTPPNNACVNLVPANAQRKGWLLHQDPTGVWVHVFAVLMSDEILLFKQEQCKDRVSSHTTCGASVDSVGWQQLSTSTTAAEAFRFNIFNSTGTLALAAFSEETALDWMKSLYALARSHRSQPSSTSVPVQYPDAVSENLENIKPWMNAMPSKLPDQIRKEGWVVVSKCPASQSPKHTALASRLDFTSRRVVYTDSWKQRYAVVSDERMVFFMDSTCMVPCEELVLLGGSVELLGQPVYGLEALPKFVQLQSHILKISMVARVLNNSPPSMKMTMSAAASTGLAVAVTMLLGTSVAREAEAWKAVLLHARDNAERHLLPDTHLRNALTMPRTQRERSARTKLFADIDNPGAACVASSPQPTHMVSTLMASVSQDRQDKYLKGVSRHTPAPQSPHGLGASKACPAPSASREEQPALIHFPTSTVSSRNLKGEAAHRLGAAATAESLQGIVDSSSRCVYAGSTSATHLLSSSSGPFATSLTQQAPRAPFGKDVPSKDGGLPETVSANHLYLSSDVKDMISEVMQLHPEFNTLNDAIRAALQHLDSSKGFASHPAAEAATHPAATPPRTSTSTTAAIDAFHQWVPSVNASSAPVSANCNELRVPPQITESFLGMSSRKLSAEYSRYSQTSHDTPAVKRPNLDSPLSYGAGTPASHGRPRTMATSASTLGLATPWGKPSFHPVGLGTTDISDRGLRESSPSEVSPDLSDNRYARRNIGAILPTTSAGEQRVRSQNTYADAPHSTSSHATEQSWLGASSLQQSHDAVILASPVVAQRSPEIGAHRGQAEIAQDFLSFYRNSRAQAHASGLKPVPSVMRSPGFPQQ